MGLSEYILRLQLTDETEDARMKNEDQVPILNTFGAPNFGCLFV